MVIRIPFQHVRRVLPALALGLGLAAAVFAQTEVANGVVKDVPLVSTTSPIVAAGTSWASLSPGQKEALEPLASTWPSLTPGHQKKWIALVQKYPELTEADQLRLSSRMVDWAALSPKDRELARLQFAQTKKLSVDSRAAHWEAYQALPESEKKELLDAAPKKPVGVAVAVKPVAADKLAAVPFTRNTPAPLRAEVQQGKLVDRYTLLPQLQADSNSVLAPVLPAK